MVDSISDTSSLLQAKLSRAKTADSTAQAQQAQGSNRFGPDVDVVLSDEAKAHLREHQDIFSGLSNDQSKKLYGVLGKIDKLFQSVGDREPTEKEEKQLAALEDEVVNIIGEEKANKLFGDSEEQDLFANLSEQDSKVLENILNDIDKIFEQAGDTPLSVESKKQLEALATKVDTLLGSETAKLFREDLNSAIEDHG